MAVMRKSLFNFFNYDIVIPKEGGLIERDTQHRSRWTMNNSHCVVYMNPIYFDK